MKYFFDKCKWVERVIDSCETIPHTESCKNLIENLFQMHKNDLSTISHEIFLLENRLENKTYSLK